MQGGCVAGWHGSAGPFGMYPVSMAACAIRWDSDIEQWVVVLRNAHWLVGTPSARTPHGPVLYTVPPSAMVVALFRRSASYQYL